ncbi:uncharacterized protein LOC143368553 [Andrena cerasifolii]|uniref:uncharacterized protein LOC143368553 n=1 Tax=Andrena cerasifolii TaxID=2819439 RepID=UPI00403805A7
MDVSAFSSSASRMTVHRTLRENMLHPYSYVRVQHLHPGDGDQRVEYSVWLLGEVQRNPSFCKYILWTDEALFNREGCFNSHNRHLWSDENPLALRTRAAQVRWSINVWAGICGEYIVGPYMLPDRMDGPAYKVFLEHVLPDLMNHIPNEIRRNMFYQQDGAGPHYATIARDYLNQTFQDRWIGRGGPVAWPPRSPDMTPLDFFFWGYLKDEVYRQPVDTLEDIVVRIHAAVANITPQTLLAVQRLNKSNSLFNRLPFNKDIDWK